MDPADITKRLIIGVGIIAAALLRNVSTKVLLAIALGVLVPHPLIDVYALPVALRAVLYERVRTGAFRSMYPVVPWIGLVLLGLVVGRDALTRAQPVRRWLALAGVSLGAFLVIRLAGGYGNAYSYTSIASLDFRIFAASRTRFCERESVSSRHTPYGWRC